MGFFMNKKTKAYLVLMVLFLLGQTTSAQSPGGSAGHFLTIPDSAKALSLGNTMSTSQNSSEALFGNPAGLTKTGSLAFSMMHAPYVHGSHFQAVALSKSQGTRSAMALGYKSVFYGKISQTDGLGQPMGSAKPQDQAFYLSGAHTFPRTGPLSFLQGWSLGGTIKIVRSTLIHSAGTKTADIGVMSPLWHSALQFGFTGKNLGGQLRYRQTKESLPRQWRMGCVWSYLPQTKIYWEGIMPAGKTIYSAMGIEYNVARHLTARAGFNQYVFEKNKNETGLSLGIGWSKKSWGMDYAFRSQGPGWACHMMAFHIRFDPALPGIAPVHRQKIQAGQLKMKQGLYYEAFLLFHEVLHAYPHHSETRSLRRKAYEKTKHKGNAP